MININLVVYLLETIVKRNTIKKYNTINKEIKKPAFSELKEYTFNTFSKNITLLNKQINSDTNKINLT